MKYLLLLISTIFLFTLFTSPSKAQSPGSYNCEWLTGAARCIVNTSDVASQFCDDWTGPSQNCEAQSDSASCGNASDIPCVPPDPTPTPPPPETFPDGYYTCVWDPESLSCAQYPSHSCVDGFRPGQACNSAQFNECRDTLFPCEPGEEQCGKSGQPCCPNFACGTSLQCNMDTFRCEDKAQNQTDPAASGSVTLIKCTVRDKLGINTAIGCIPIATQTLLSEFFILWTIGVSGGTSLFLFAYSAYLLILGSRDPRKKLLGQDIFYSALSGLIMLILALYFLNAIGIGILGLVQLSI